MTRQIAYCAVRIKVFLITYKTHWPTYYSAGFAVVNSEVVGLAPGVETHGVAKKMHRHCLYLNNFKKNLLSG
jgi:hypothetical protein